jgi:EpsI family protein
MRDSRFTNHDPRFTWALAVLLGLTYAMAQVARPVAAPFRVALDRVPMTLSDWTGESAPPLAPDVARILAADQYVHRYYAAPDGRSIEMDIAYYAQPHVGGTAHSPLNCLPGNGWTMSEPAVRTIRTAAGAWNVREIAVSRGNSRWAMTYWFQGRQRVEADEFGARLNLFKDALRRRPADTAMVRVMTPVSSGDIASITDPAAHAMLAAFSGDLIPQVHRALLTAR